MSTNQNEKLNPVTKSIINAQLSRRGVLAGVGAIGASVALASCGTGSGDTATKTIEDVSDTEKIVRWASWPYYLDFDEDSKKYPTLEAFAAKTGITPTYKEDIDDNNTFYGKVQGQLKIGSDIGYDVVTPTDWMVDRWIQLGYAAKFDEANIPNKTNIRAILNDVGYDQGRQYSLTWQSGFAGFGWNTEKIKKGVHTIDDLFAKENKGRIMVLSELRDTMGIIMLYQGVDPSKPFTEDKFMNAIDFLQKKIKDGFIIGIRGNEYTQDLRSGNATAVFGWSGDMFQLAAESDGKFDFAIPDSGGMIANDNFMIPSTTPSVDAATELVNYYYDPVVAATVAAWVNYVCPVKGAQEAMEKVDPSLANSEYIFPTAKTTSRLSIFRALTAAEETKFQTAFQTAAGNA